MFFLNVIAFLGFIGYNRCILNIVIYPFKSCLSIFHAKGSFPYVPAKQLAIENRTGRMSSTFGSLLCII